MFNRLFEKKQRTGPVAPSVQGLVGPKVPRHSGGWAALRKRLQAQPGLRVIDVGYTSPANINYLTGLGHSVFLADLVQDACANQWTTPTGPDTPPVWNVDGFLAQALNFSGRTFDVVLLWTSLDYLPEPFVVPVVERLFSAMNPGGQVLAFFHTRPQGEETINCRFHLTALDDVEMQLAQQFPLQRVFTNRSIERLFAPWSGLKQYLAKDSILEAVITR